MKTSILVVSEENEMVDSFYLVEKADNPVVPGVGDRIDCDMLKGEVTQRTFVYDQDDDGDVIVRVVVVEDPED